MASGGYFAIGFRSIQVIQVRLRKPDYKPPFSRASKIPRTDAGYRVADGSIAAIDFGTTSVSVAFLTKGDKKVTTLILDREDQSTRVPNAVLFEKKDNGKMKIEAFGSLAQKKFTSMRSKEQHAHVYFERIKMLMRREKVVDRDTVVESFSGDKFYLVEVIAFILQHLKDLLMYHFSCTVKPLKTTDFDWVITVPAIWDARGKRMMREAAYLAGLLTEHDGITKFTPVSHLSLPLPDEVNPDRLSLALEPEAAAFYSQETVGDQIESDPDTSIIQHPSDYMVIDAGGGTIDITAHIEVNGSIVVENIPTGNAWGGTQVNEAFSKILEGIVNDPGFEKFLASGDRSQNMADIIKIFYTEFEGEKSLFGKEQTEEIRITLPSRFVKFYDKALAAGVKSKSGIDYEDDVLFISKEVVESELFGPALNGIIECTLEAIKANDNDHSTFYLVGGFGGCKYVHKKVKAALEKSLNDKGRSCNVIVPPTPQLAVAQGAVMWRKNPEKIKARRSDATYGIGVSLPFKDDEHDEHYKFYNEEQKEYRCTDIFSVFLEKGELVQTDQVITISLAPLHQSDKQITIGIYSTPNLGVRYTKNTNGKSTVIKIGQLVIDIPNPNNVPRNERHVDITMDFSGTEIQAKAKYRITGEEVKTVCDFLSAQQT